jgi:hypothetical protein
VTLLRVLLLFAVFAVLAARARGAEPRGRDLGIPITNTNAVGVVRDAIIQYAYRRWGGGMGALFEATVGATEEAIINALVAGRTMTGHKGYTVPGLPHDRLVELLRRHNRLPPASGR